MDVVIGIDCGLNGAISIIDDKSTTVHQMPVKKEKKSGKTKNVMDTSGLVSILSKYKDKKVVCGIERQGVRPGEGGVSALTIGVGYGLLQGVAYAFGFDVKIISPVSWKKHFPELTTKEMEELKLQQKELKEKDKTEKDKAKKKENKKEIEKLGRQVKVIAKDGARILAAKKNPELADLFKLKKNDGMAESLLICYFVKENLDKLTGDPKDESDQDQNICQNSTD